MLNNDGARLKLAMVEPFDYRAFKDRCGEEGLPAMPLMEYAQKLGMVMTAKTMYPELPEAEAYRRLIDDSRDDVLIGQVRKVNNRVSQKTGCCGGGGVR
jgi:hypothetical protein